MLFYLYPETKINYNIAWDYDKYFCERWYKEAYSALLNNVNRIENPEKADFFVVPFTLFCLSFVSFKIREIEYKLTKLPFWNDGKKHIVFDFTDSPKTFYRNKNVSVFKSAFSRDNYDYLKDVSIPQFPRYRFSEEMINKYNKQKLISFKGHPRTGFNSIRDKLFEINNNEELFIKKFSNEPKDFEFKIGETFEIIPSNNEYSYLNLLFTSRFTLLPRGNGCALSYRHIEAMNVGSIPVIISDNYELPFKELIDWYSCSITVKESELNNLLDIVKSHLHREDDLKKNVKDVYAKYFSSTVKIIETAIDIYINKNIRS